MKCGTWRRYAYNQPLQVVRVRLCKGGCTECERDLVFKADYQPASFGWTAELHDASKEKGETLCRE